MFGRLLLIILALMTASELALGTAIYRRLRADVESDLGQRLVRIAQVMALGVDIPLVIQFQRGDERLAAYRLVQARLSDQARAADVARAYVVNTGLQTLVDSGRDALVGDTRYALLANQPEIARALTGQASPTHLYLDEERRPRLSAIAPLRVGSNPVVALIGVDATLDFFDSLGQLWRLMVALGVATILTVGGAGLILIRQVSRRLWLLRNAVSRVTRGDFTARAGLVGRDEIGALGRDLDTMIGSVLSTHDYYESVLASVDVALLTTDTRGEIVGANMTATRLLAPEGYLVGRRVQEIFQSESTLADLMKKALEGWPTTLVQEVPLGGGLSAGGRIAAAVISPLRQAGAWTGVALSLSDITELRLLERRARMNDRLAALGSMAAGLLHEIRSPLASIVMYLDLLPSHVEAIEGHEILRRATATAERLSHFLQDFQIFAGLRPLRREWMDAAEILDVAVDGVGWPPNINLARIYSGRAIVHADRRLFEHAVRNLLQNAVEALYSRGGTITIGIAHRSDELIVSVQDDGPGIPPEQVDRIFDPMFTSKSGGTGLGLTIVQRVVEAHGGTVEVVSQPGSGATFRTSWPSIDTTRS
jgi:signal transduction histidine kinase